MLTKNPRVNRILTELGDTVVAGVLVDMKNQSFMVSIMPVDTKYPALLIKSDMMGKILDLLWMESPAFIAEKLSGNYKTTIQARFKDIWDTLPELGKKYNPLMLTDYPKVMVFKNGRYVQLKDRFMKED